MWWRPHLCNRFEWMARLLGIWAAWPGKMNKSTVTHCGLHSFYIIDLQLDLHKPIYDKKGLETKLPYQKFVQITAGHVHTCAIGDALNLKHPIRSYQHFASLFEAKRSVLLSRRNFKYCFYECRVLRRRIIWTSHYE